MCSILFPGRSSNMFPRSRLVIFGGRCRGMYTPPKTLFIVQNFRHSLEWLWSENERTVMGNSGFWHASKQKLTTWNWAYILHLHCLSPSAMRALHSTMWLKLRRGANTSKKKRLKRKRKTHGSLEKGVSHHKTSPFFASIANLLWYVPKNVAIDDVVALISSKNI